MCDDEFSLRHEKLSKGIYALLMVSRCSHFLCLCLRRRRWACFQLRQSAPIDGVRSLCTARHPAGGSDRDWSAVQGPACPWVRARGPCGCTHFFYSLSLFTLAVQGDLAGMLREQLELEDEEVGPLMMALKGLGVRRAEVSEQRVEVGVHALIRSNIPLFGVSVRKRTGD